MDIDVANLVYRLVPIDRRIDKHVIEEEDLLGVLLIPALSVLRVGRIEIGISSQRGHEGGFVVRGTTHKTIREACPDRDRVSGRGQFLSRIAGREKSVRANTMPVRNEEGLLERGIVQGVVQASNGTRTIAKRGVRCYIGDALSIDVDCTTIAQALQVFRAVQWTSLVPRCHTPSPPGDNALLWSSYFSLPIRVSQLIEQCLSFCIQFAAGAWRGFAHRVGRQKRQSNC